MAMKSSPAKWPAVPAPAVDILSLPGLAFIRATSSCTFFAGSDGVTASRVGLITKRPTGVKSFNGSNDTFLIFGRSASVPEPPYTIV
jgi:hypothetical protein